MTYETKPTNRNDIRMYAQIFRLICNFTPTELIDPVVLLDKLPSIEFFRNVDFEIVEDSTLPPNVPAQCMPTQNGYHIVIKESVYVGAYERQTGGYRMHIMHEIMHVFADLMGFKPILSRNLHGEKIPKFRDLEWIVKAMTGEVLIPYETSKGMSAEAIMENFLVSREAAEYRLKL